MTLKPLGAMWLSSVALTVVSSGAARQQAAAAHQASPPIAPIRITSVTPQSVLAGASFRVVVELQAGFSKPVTLSVHRVGLNIEQYRSRALSDNDDLDAAPESGIIIHRIPTDAKWTSAQSANSLKSDPDRYLVSIEDPVVLQVNQQLRVVRTAAAVDINTVRGWIANVQKGLDTYSRVQSTAAAGDKDRWTIYDLKGTEAVEGDPDGGTYFVVPRQGHEWEAAYIRKKDFFVALPSDAASSEKAATRKEFTTPSALKAITSAQKEELANEADSLGAIVASLSPAARVAISPALDAVRERMNQMGIVRQ